jgi:hypothetical protein
MEGNFNISMYCYTYVAVGDYKTKTSLSVIFIIFMTRETSHCLQVNFRRIMIKAFTTFVRKGENLF